MKTIIITVGDELLNGDITDTNASWLSQELTLIGAQVIERLTVPDQRNAILQSFTAAKKKANLIIITGGLGPTEDDLTKECFAKFFDSSLIENPELRQKIEQFYLSRGRSVEEVSEKMVILPENCTILPNEYGIAPGMWQEQDNVVFISLPGVPFEMKGIVTDFVLPKLSAEFSLNKIRNHYFNTLGTGEVQLEKRLKAITSELPAHLSIAYLPSFAKVTIRLTGQAENETELKTSFDHFVPLIREELAPELYSETRGESIVSALAKLCKQQELTIATAESCTGGNIASEIVALSGSSSFYKGSIVAYHNNIKTALLGVKEQTLEEFGAVSEQVVDEMAIGALNQLKVDYSLAISGIAGPTGGSAEKPVGTVCIAVANSSSKRVKTFTFAKNRAKNIQLFTTVALTMLYRFIQEHKQ